MEPVAKRARTGGGGGSAAVDRLSSLPDALLHAVMSSLPARQMVQTCVLSKRWVHLWRSVPSLNLDSREFLLPIYDRWQKMEDFTTNLLMFHHAPTLDAFSIRADVAVGKHGRHVDRWIRCGIKYCPRVLDIAVATVDSRYRLPDLASGSCRLGRLHLSYVALHSGFARQVRDSCPVLRCLELHRCLTKFSHIESSTLNRLVIEDSMGGSDSLAISAPRLASLRLVAFLFHTYKNGVSLNGANSLVEASVAVKSGRTSPEGEAMLLCGLFSVSSLELKGIQELLVFLVGLQIKQSWRLAFTTLVEISEFQAILHEKFDKSQSFHNLRTLSLDNCFQAEGDADVDAALDSWQPVRPILSLQRLEDKVTFVQEPDELSMFYNLKRACCCSIASSANVVGKAWEEHEHNDEHGDRRPSLAAAPSQSPAAGLRAAPPIVSTRRGREPLHGEARQRCRRRSLFSAGLSSPHVPAGRRRHIGGDIVGEDAVAQ
uniref:OSJNBa0064D20.3 protein n=1 Tax=Oryza sativa subsp. japonica TaxID=39947 RepID=Q7FA10_ORYSJ|nr:OSJNBa0064D20.3 [Oryza sativa Japonica Group]